MANIKSAIKRIQVSKRNEQRNISYRSAVKTAIKKLFSTVEEGNLEKVQEDLSKAYAIIDKAVRKKILHRNNGARKKSRLARYAKKIIKAS